MLWRFEKLQLLLKLTILNTSRHITIIYCFYASFFYKCTLNVLIVCNALSMHIQITVSDVL